MESLEAEVCNCGRGFELGCEGDCLVPIEIDFAVNLDGVLCEDESGVIRAYNRDEFGGGGILGAASIGEGYELLVCGVHDEN